MLDVGEFANFLAFAFLASTICGFLCELCNSSARKTCKSDVCSLRPFAVIDVVVVIDRVKHFVLTKVCTAHEVHTLSYIVTDVSNRLFMTYSDLKFKWPLPVYKYKGRQTVVIVNSHTYICMI